MNISYMIYEAERTRSAAEQRAVDVRAGELAAAITRGRRGRRMLTRRQGTGHRGTRRTMQAPLSWAIPRPR